MSDYYNDDFANVVGLISLIFTCGPCVVIALVVFCCYYNNKRNSQYAGGAQPYQPTQPLNQQTQQVYVTATPYTPQPQPVVNTPVYNAAPAAVVVPAAQVAPVNNSGPVPAAIVDYGGEPDNYETSTGYDQVQRF